MGTTPLPKPQSLRLTLALDTQVRAYAKTLALHQKSKRPAMNKALLALVEAGLKAICQDPSPKESMLEALKELDPEWSGLPLRDIAPVNVATRSGKSPLQLLLERRG